MKKFKITTEQYNRLFSINESIDVKGGINRVDTTFKKEFKKVPVNKLSEDKFDITAPVNGISNTKMKKKPEHKPINDINEEVNSELTSAIEHFIKNIWLNPTQHSLSTYFVDNGVMWKDIIAFLINKGIITQQGNAFKVNNVFKRSFSRDEKEAMEQKTEDIKNITLQIASNTDAPWNKEKISTNTDVEEGGEKPVVHDYKGLSINREIALLQGNDGIYVFDYGDKLPNIDYELDDLVEYVNNNIASISKGEGMRDFDANIDLVRVDDALKNELLALYSKDKKLVSSLSKITETTSAASSGAFTGKLGVASTGPKPSEEILSIEDETPLEETTTTASSGQYVQPQIWAKNKANWKAAHKTQYPKGEMVRVGDNKIKTTRTKQSVISRTVYESIAKKTGKTPDEVKRIIESRVKPKPLTKN